MCSGVGVVERGEEAGKKRGEGVERRMRQVAGAIGIKCTFSLCPVAFGCTCLASAPGQVRRSLQKASTRPGNDNI